ncbi:Protein-tyrosine phosphatase [Dictyocaulus viviparus]|uniref:Protein-tyrosine phosphatase n=1 Tax=Dictyocaulus viviparus TaxID=29172 RepID=A0A0D8YCL3_DICVI|nr:Protein-tyrosine phosphatase [Dictyocaulus viviparus]
MCIPKRSNRSDADYKQRQKSKSGSNGSHSDSDSDSDLLKDTAEAEQKRNDGTTNKSTDNEEAENGNGDTDLKQEKKFVDQSFKVAKTSKHAGEMVSHWVNRALDMGVPKLIEEFRMNLSKWQPEGMTTNAFLANRDKNRYLDVPCQDQRRVILNWPGLPNDYIHANYVANPARDHRFICAQGKFKCSQYWPREKGESMSVGEGEGKITITNLDVRPLSEADSFVRVCRLKLQYSIKGKPITSTVTHYQWENWPDRGVPSTNLTATKLLSAVRGTTKPIIIHCSAGIGRTGTIAAIAYVQEKMQHGQYIYVHRVLLAYFLEKYRDRFSQILEGEGEAKYAKWLEDYKIATGCD